MHIKVFNRAQACHVAQAIYEYWHNSHAMFQTRSLQVLGQFHASQTEGFHEYIAELVCDCLLCVFPMLIIPQCEMWTIFESTKEFNLGVSFTNTDVSLIQECVALATEHLELSMHWTNVIALITTMMVLNRKDGQTED